MDAIFACGALRKSIPCVSFYCISNTKLGSASRYKINDVHLRAPFPATFQIIPLKNVFRASSSTLFSKAPLIEAVLAIDDYSNKASCSQLRTDTIPEQLRKEKPAEDNKDHQSQSNSAALHEETKTSADFSKCCASTPEKEIERRKKIALANKGRTPWNKGRTHTEETRARIRLRTIQALSDPKVRIKMSGYSRSHSERSRSRISSSLRKVWEKRLRYKRLQDKCYLMWAGSIAEVARKGSADQDELEWDSYEKIKSYHLAKYLKMRAKKARERADAKIRAEIAAKVRAENAEKRAQKALEKEERAKARELKILARKKLEKEKMKMALSKGLKLKARLAKQLGNSSLPQREMELETRADTEELNIELIKKRKKQKRVSLAEQIRIAKNRKACFHRDNPQLNNNSNPEEQNKGEPCVILHSTHTIKHDILD